MGAALGKMPDRESLCGDERRLPRVERDVEDRPVDAGCVVVDDLHNNKFEIKF